MSGLLQLGKVSERLKRYVSPWEEIRGLTAVMRQVLPGKYIHMVKRYLEAYSL